MRFCDLARDITEFHVKFGLNPISLGGEPEFKLRYDRLQEELNELELALQAGNEAEFLDALVDTVYIAVGTLYLYDFRSWFTNVYNFQVMPCEPCVYMNNFPVGRWIERFHNLKGEGQHCIELPMLINEILAYSSAHNWPFDDAWKAVHAANMAKERAKPDASDSKHKSAQDIVKPAGWKSPDIQAIIDLHKGITKNPEQLEMDV